MPRFETLGSLNFLFLFAQGVRKRGKPTFPQFHLMALWGFLEPLGGDVSSTPIPLVDLEHSFGRSDFSASKPGQVSKKHFLLCGTSPPTIEDRSTNGTYVNGARLVSKTPFVLHHGDRIVLGAADLGTSGSGVAFIFRHVTSSQVSREINPNGS